MATEHQETSKNSGKQIIVDFTQGGNPFDSVVTKPLDQPTGLEVDEPKEVDEKEETPRQSTRVENTTESESDENVEIDETSEEVDQEEQELEATEEEIPGDDDLEDDEESEVNPYFYLGQQLRSDGFLPEDLDINDETSGIAVYNAYKDKLKQDIEPQVRNEIAQKLKTEGYGTQDLLVARALRQGVDVSLLSESTMYERYATMPDDVDDSVKKESIVQMYKSRQFQESEIRNQLAIAEENDSLDELYSTSRQYFGQKWNSWVQQENERAAQYEEAQRREAEKVENLIKTSLSKREILGEKFDEGYAKELEEAIYTPNVLLDHNGQKYRVTALQKFLYEWETNPEMKLYLFKKFLFRDLEKEQIKKNVKREVENEFLKGYEKSISRNTKSSKNKKVKNKLEQNKTNKKQYFVGFDS